MDGSVRQRQGTILGSTRWTLPLALLGMPALDLWVVPPPGIDAMADRLAFAARCNAIALLPYFAVCVYIMTARFLGGAHDPLSHVEAPGLKIDCRVMQNHLEQTFAFAIAAFALAVTLPAQHLQALPIATGVFVIGRLVYWWGYHRDGTLGRAPGVQLTTAVTLPMVMLAAALAIA